MHVLLAEHENRPVLSQLICTVPKPAKMALRIILAQTRKDEVQLLGNYHVLLTVLEQIDK